MKQKTKCKRPTKEKIIYQLGGQISEEEAEKILNHLEQLCELLLEQLNDG